MTRLVRMCSASCHLVTVRVAGSMTVAYGYGMRQIVPVSGSNEDPAAVQADESLTALTTKHPSLSWPYRDDLLRCNLPGLPIVRGRRRA